MVNHDLKSEKCKWDVLREKVEYQNRINSMCPQIKEPNNQA